MSVRQALLALLDQAPCYGSQLRTEYDRRTGSTWPLNVGQIYTTLDRLERDGLVRQGDRDPQGHLYYEITDAGRREVTDWFALPLERPVTHRDDLAAKVSLALTLPGVDAGKVIEAQRAFVETRRRALEDLRVREYPAGNRSAFSPLENADGLGQPHTPSAGGTTTTSARLAAELILESLIISAEAELRWLGIAAERITAAGYDADGMPLDTRAPRRGRPKSAPPGSA